MPASYKEKLIDYEVQPPKAAWDYISDELTKNNDLATFSGKLFDYEVAPPPDAWLAITNSLQQTHTGAKIFSLEKIQRHIYPIMAAAAILSAMVVVLFYLHQTKDFKSKLTTVQSAKPALPKDIMMRPVSQSLSEAGKPRPDEIAASGIEVPKGVNKNFNEPVKDLQNTKVYLPAFLHNGLGIRIAAKPIRNAYGEIIQDPQIMNNTDNQYISITGPNGQQTKISSKFLNMLSFINDDNDAKEADGYFDKNFFENLIWKSRFNNWRNKIINTSFVPSAANFMDIVEFRDMLMKDK